MDLNRKWPLIFFNDDYETEIYQRGGHSSYQTFQELYRRLGVSEKVLIRHLQVIVKNHHKVMALVKRSPLPEKQAENFKDVLNDRFRKLQKA